MTLSLGVGVGVDRIRAVAVRGGAVAWAGEAEFGDAQGPGPALRELLASAPLPRWPRPSVALALGPAAAQLRRITGLPEVTDERMLTQVVRESAGKFFLRNGKPLATTRVRVIAPGEVWCAAFEQGMVDALAAACRASGLAVRGVVPTVAVLGRALAGERLAWRDGEVRVEVERSGDGGLGAVRRTRVPAGDGAEDGGMPVPALARIGANAAAFADAYGAALLRRGEPLALEPGGDDAGPAPWRLPLAAAALTLSLAAAAVLPVRAARQAERDALARLDRVSAGRTAARQAHEGELRVTAALAEVAAFDSARYAQTRLLADLNRALPAGSALVSLTVDSAGGSVVALTPRAAAVLAPLERVAGVSGAVIVGTVTREVVAGRELERVGIRFGISAAARRERDRAAGGGAP
ncbi:MAG TPA: hypothetical protein VFS20_04335 [Longimicrobium sp.]|nr:hypothetical protein [Longimicrobium sp.]